MQKINIYVKMTTDMTITKILKFLNTNFTVEYGYNSANTKKDLKVD